MVDRDREIAALAPKSVGLSDSALCARQMCGARRQADGAEKSLPRTLDWLPNTSTAPLGPTAHVPCSCQWTNRIIQFCESSNIKHCFVLTNYQETVSVSYRMCKTPYISVVNE